MNLISIRFEDNIIVQRLYAEGCTADYPGVIIITSGVISYMVPEIIENLQQTTVVENEDLVLLGLQEDENWLVIIVDFPDFPSSDAIGVSQAENILNEQGQDIFQNLAVINPLFQ